MKIFHWRTQLQYICNKVILKIQPHLKPIVLEICRWVWRWKSFANLSECLKLRNLVAYFLWATRYKSMIRRLTAGVLRCCELILALIQILQHNVVWSPSLLGLLGFVMALKWSEQQTSFVPPILAHRVVWETSHQFADSSFRLGRRFVTSSVTVTCTCTCVGLQTVVKSTNVMRHEWLVTAS